MLVACRECWECDLVKVNDLVGRCLAEKAVSDHTVLVTLTYGRSVAGDPSHEAATVLTYRHVQLFLKRLRNDGYNVRYMASGEYGSLRGRAHWHIILFFTGKVPDWPKDERFHSDFWSDEAGEARGFVHVCDVDYLGMKYAAKYILKDANAAQSRSSYSRFPPLGEAYFRALALRMARAGVQPTAPTYVFDVTRTNGEQRRVTFRMRGVTLQRFMETWLDEYLARGFELDPSGAASEMVESFIKYGRVVNYELAKEYYFEKAEKDARSDARLKEIEAKAVQARGLSARYRSVNTATDLGGYFWTRLKDGEKQGQGQSLRRQLLNECREIDPAFNPYSKRWSATLRHFDISRPFNSRKVECDRLPAREAARRRRLVARVRQLFRK